MFQTGEPDTLNSISQYIVKSTSPSSNSPEIPDDHTTKRSSEESDLDVAKMSATWAQTVAQLEHFVDSKDGLCSQTLFYMLL